MTWINKTRVVRLVAGIAVSALVAFGMTAGSAQARWDHPDHDWHHWHHGWSGGYWVAPPVVYGSPYAYGYYPPPRRRHQSAGRQYRHSLSFQRPDGKRPAQAGRFVF